MCVFVCVCCIQRLFQDKITTVAAYDGQILGPRNGNLRIIDGNCQSPKNFVINTRNDVI